MPRKPRLFQDNETSLINQPVTVDLKCFKSNEDYQYFLITLHSAINNYNISLHAFVLMDNCFKLLITPTKATDISLMIQSLKSQYSKYFNQKYNNKDTIWEGRFKSSPVQSPDLILACMRYIESQPVKKGNVCNPEHYQWSSFIDNTQNTTLKRRVQLTENDIYSYTSDLIIEKENTTRANNQINEQSNDTNVNYSHITRLDTLPLITEHKRFTELGNTLFNRKDCYKQLFFMEHNQVEHQYFSERVQHSYPIGNKAFIKGIEQEFGVTLSQIKPGRPAKNS